MRFGKKLQLEPIPEAPVFIIGHWRTGSTFLHQLMALDPLLKAPTLFEVAIPDGFLSSHRYYKPVMAGLLTKYRPMDKVRIGMDEPQEDEYAIYRITDASPLEQLVFPRSANYFLMEDERWVPEGEARIKWMETVRTFYGKITFKTGRTLISKNPFNSMRIPELTEMFPGARFIHIVRHPYEVIPSSVNMWSILHRQNRLNDRGKAPETADVAGMMEKMLSVIRAEMHRVSAARAEIRYEDFTQDPIGSLKTVYKSLQLDFTPEFETKARDFLHKNQDFEKNSFTLTPEEKKIISAKLSNHMEFYGYKS